MYQAAQFILLTSQVWPGLSYKSHARTSFRGISVFFCFFVFGNFAVECDVWHLQTQLMGCLQVPAIGGLNIVKVHMDMGNSAESHWYHMAV